MANELRIRKPPLRRPGQSLDELASLLWNDKLGGYIAAVFCVSMLVAASWFYWFEPLKDPPYLLTVLALLVIVFICWRMYRVIKHVIDVEKGSVGEKIVGDALDDLRAEGYKVFHDIPAFEGGKKFNLDHVLVATNGIFVIETKMRTKDEPGQVVEYDGISVKVNGFTTDEPLRQAQANADWLQHRLKDTTDRDFSIQPVLLYPGWWIKGKSSGRRIWVLNEKALPGFLAHEKDCLTEADLSLVADRLGMMSREGTTK